MKPRTRKNRNRNHNNHSHRHRHKRYLSLKCCYICVHFTASLALLRATIAAACTGVSFSDSHSSDARAASSSEIACRSRFIVSGIIALVSASAWSFDRHGREIQISRTQEHCNDVPVASMVCLVTGKTRFVPLVGKI